MRSKQSHLTQLLPEFNDITHKMVNVVPGVGEALNNDFPASPFCNTCYCTGWETIGLHCGSDKNKVALVQVMVQWDRTHYFLIVEDPWFFFFFFGKGGLSQGLESWCSLHIWKVEKSSGSVLEERSGEQLRHREKLGPLSPAIPWPQIPAHGLFLAWPHLPIYN